MVSQEEEACLLSSQDDDWHAAITQDEAVATCPTAFTSLSRLRWQRKPWMFFGVLIASFVLITVQVSRWGCARSEPSLLSAERSGLNSAVSASRVFTAGEGRVVCTKVKGKDVYGDTFLDVFDAGKQFASDADHCIQHCKDMPDCGCYAYDEHKDHGCWIKKNPCGGHFDPTEPDPSPEMVSGECSVCPYCSPEGEHKQPTVVIPFYERDICKMKMTAASITKHDPHHVLGDVLLLWLSKRNASEWQHEIDVMMDSIRYSRKVEFHSFQSHFTDSNMPGWFVQQVMKLKAASLVRTDYYVILDAKNSFIRDIGPETFISPCNQGMVYADQPWSHLTREKRWYKKAAAALDVTIPENRNWSGSITPVVMHTKTVLDLLEYLTEGRDPVKLCDGKLCDYINSGATEFTLYFTYVATKADEKCIHHYVDRNPAKSLWRGASAELNERTARAAADDEGVIIFGAQPGALRELSDSARQGIQSQLARAFSQAGLHDPSYSTEQSLADCVAQPSE